MPRPRALVVAAAGLAARRERWELGSAVVDLALGDDALNGVDDGTFHAMR